MNKKVIGVLVGSVVIVVASAGYYVVRLRMDVAKWSGPMEEIVSEENRSDGPVSFSRYEALLDAPVEKVQEALWLVEKSADLIENVRVSKLTKHAGNTKVVEMQFQALSLPAQAFTMEFQLDSAAHRVSFRTLQSQTQDLKGSYQLASSPDGKATSITYEVERRDKVNLPVPKSVVDSASRQTFVNTVRGLRRWIKGPTG